MDDAYGQHIKNPIMPLKVSPTLEACGTFVVSLNFKSSYPNLNFQRMLNLWVDLTLLVRHMHSPKKIHKAKQTLGSLSTHRLWSTSH
jgi:hypothetical protein